MESKFISRDLKTMLYLLLYFIHYTCTLHICIVVGRTYIILAYDTQ